MSTEVMISHRLADNRWLLYVDGRVRYVGSEEECERRARLLYGGKNPGKLSDEQYHRILGY